MENKNDLSVFIIAKNEEKNLPRCLSSVKDLADEIVVIDGFSDDKTAQTAESYGAKVYRQNLVSFTEQKQFALDKCSCKWVLNLDADEYLSDELKAEIPPALKSAQADGTVLFFLPFVNVFLGRRMKHSGLAGRFKERLALRSSVRYEGGRVHEYMKAEGKTARLTNPFIHTPYRDIEHYFEKFNAYTSLGAKSLYEKRKKFNFLNLVRAPFDFAKIYIFEAAFLDGMQGFLWALFSSFYPTVKYAKLWLIYQREGKDK